MIYTNDMHFYDTKKYKCESVTIDGKTFYVITTRE
jgi:hypothetical protein